MGLLAGGKVLVMMGSVPALEERQMTLVREKLERFFGFNTASAL